MPKRTEGKLVLIVNVILINKHFHFVLINSSNQFRANGRSLKKYLISKAQTLGKSNRSEPLIHQYVKTHRRKMIYRYYP